MKCEHKWNKSEEDLITEMIDWHNYNNAPEGHFYISKYEIHYWQIIRCVNCGEEKLFSSVFDNNDNERVSDEEFLWLSIFINQLNEEVGYIEEKKQLINDALDQMQWQYFPYVSLHTPEKNYFSISYKNNNFLRYNWDFYDAANLFRKMNLLAIHYLYPISSKELTEKLNDLDILKSKYITLMEIASQSGVDFELRKDLDALSFAFEKLSKEIETLIRR